MLSYVKFPTLGQCVGVQVSTIQYTYLLKNNKDQVLIHGCQCRYLVHNTILFQLYLYIQLDTLQHAINNYSNLAIPTYLSLSCRSEIYYNFSTYQISSLELSSALHVLSVLYTINSYGCIQVLKYQLYHTGTWVTKYLPINPIIYF